MYHIKMRARVLVIVAPHAANIRPIWVSLASPGVRRFQMRVAVSESPRAIPPDQTTSQQRQDSQRAVSFQAFRDGHRKALVDRVWLS
jgi:hypothetical protein